MNPSSGEKREGLGRAPLASCWIPIEDAREGEPVPFTVGHLSIVMTAKFDEGVFFYRDPVHSEGETR